MGCILVFSEDVSLVGRLCGLARSLASDPADCVHAVTLGAPSADFLMTLGAEKVTVLKSDSAWPEAYAPAVAKLIGEVGPQLVLMAATPRGKDIAAGVAARIGSGLVSEAFAVRRGDSGFETDRLMYGGLAVCTEGLPELTIVTVPAGSLAETTPAPGLATEIVLQDVAVASLAMVGEVCPIARTGADIAAAQRVVCVGRGIGAKEDLALATELAEAIDGVVGCSRSIAEDFGWMPEDTYIGISGKTIHPKLYISLGISGQVQHVAGIRDSKIIVGIDSNENAPIFAAADYGIVGDLYEIAPLLTAALKAR